MARKLVFILNLIYFNQFHTFQSDKEKMRQLKGKVKESAREKKQRKKEFAETQKQVLTIALPTIIAVFIFVIAYVYIKTRPKNSYD